MCIRDRTCAETAADCSGASRDAGCFVTGRGVRRGGRAAVLLEHRVQERPAHTPSVNGPYEALQAVDFHVGCDLGCTVTRPRVCRDVTEQ
eukprot:253768-Rhodomonas_salina.1